MGNRLQKQDSATGTTNSTYDAANRLTSTATNGASASAVTSDADGNTLTDSAGRTMTWDSQNRLTSCVFGGTTSIFKYGADGLRRQATVGGVTTDYVYDGQTLIREGFASGGTLSTVKATYLQGPRGTECRIDETSQTEGYYRFDASGQAIKDPKTGLPQVFGRGVTRWYVYDGLGSVVGEVDPSGNLTSSPKYDVYGLVRSNPGTASSAMGFVGGLGHLSEAGTGLIYMKARYYDPALGRFESQDFGRQGNNWFTYCDSNPVNRVDASGRDWMGIISEAMIEIGNLILNAKDGEFRYALYEELQEQASNMDSQARFLSKDGLNDIVRGEGIKARSGGNPMIAAMGDAFVEQGGQSMARSAVLVLYAAELRDFAEIILGG